MKKIIFLLITIIIFAACGSEEVKSKETKEVKDSKIITGIEIGNKIPDFVLYDLKLNKIEASEFKGKPIILNFWATWCPPCREEMPSIESFYKKNKEKGIEVVAVSVDQDSKEKVAEFIKNKGYSFPIYYDYGAILSRTFFIRSIPTTYFIDRNGIIIDKKIGGFDWNTIDVNFLFK